MKPASVQDYRELARRRLPRMFFEYIDGGSYAEVTLGRNVADLEALPPFEGLPLARAQEILILNEIERALDARNPFLRVDFSGREMVA